MSPETSIIQETRVEFYDAFSKKDFKTMQGLYDDNATFTDEVFVGLNANQARNMWEMLLTRSTDLVVKLMDSKSTSGETGIAIWEAKYTFSKTNRKVINNVTSHLTFNNGKIIAQVDAFDFYKWARQAMGTPGILLGWTDFFKRKVQQTAMDGLNKFISRQ